MSKILAILGAGELGKQVANFALPQIRSELNSPGAEVPQGGPQFLIDPNDGSTNTDYFGYLSTRKAIWSTAIRGLTGYQENLPDINQLLL